MTEPYAFPPRKLDLLLHWVANLPHPVLLRGPAAAGMTQLLRQFQAHAQGQWLVCYIAATPNLTFEAIAAEALKVLRKPVEGYASCGEALEEQLLELQRQRRLMVLLLDDAGALMPGLLENLVRYASLQPQLKLVFALTPDDHAAKTKTDPQALRAVQVLPMGPAAEAPPAADCAAPPRWRTGVLFAVLVAVALAAVLAGRGAEDWRRLLSLASPASAPSEPAPLAPAALERPPAPAAVAATPTKVNGTPPVVAAPQPSPTAAPDSAPPPVSPASAVAPPPAAAAPPAPVEPAASAPQPPLPPVEPAAAPPAALQEAAPVPPPAPESAEAGSRSGRIESPLSAPEAAPKPAPPAAAPDTRPAAPKGKPHAMGNLHDAAWLLEQDGKAFTLQLITVSQPSRLGGFVRQFTDDEPIAMYQTGPGAVGHYVVVYGVYPSFPAALAAAGNLPKSQGKPIPRPLKAVQQDIRRSRSRGDAVPPDQPDPSNP